MSLLGFNIGDFVAMDGVRRKIYGIIAGFEWDNQFSCWLAKVHFASGETRIINLKYLKLEASSTNAKV